MTQLFVANGTHNNIDFNYSLPSVAGHRRQRIPIGKQGLIGDFSDFDVNAIIQHYSNYGLIKSDDLGGAPSGTYVAFIYSTDAPVEDEDVITLIEKNYPIMTNEMSNVIQRIKSDGTQ
jgi:hypothetical protein